MSFINPNDLTKIIRQVSAFDSQVDSLKKKGPEEEKTVKLAGLRVLAEVIQTNLNRSGVNLNVNVREISDLTSVQRVTDLFHDTISLLVSQEFSAPLEEAIKRALSQDRPQDKLSEIRTIVNQINQRSMDVNQCKFSQDCFLLEYLFQPDLFGQKISLPVLETLLALGVNPNLHATIPPIAHLLTEYRGGNYTRQETVEILKLLANHQLDVNIPTPDGHAPVLFLLKDKIYDWSLKEFPESIEMNPHYVAAPEIFEVVMELLTPENRQALLASFNSADREDLIELFNKYH